MTVSVTTQGLNPETPEVTLTELIKVLAADETGANSNSAQPWFPTNGAISVVAGTYEFEGLLYLSRAAGTTSHNTGLLFGGTATVASILGHVFGHTASSVASTSVTGIIITATTLLASAVPTSSSATEQAIMRVRGIIRFSAAGTLIPQFQYSAAPGGAPTVKRNSFFRLRRLGAADLATIGTWG